MAHTPLFQRLLKLTSLAQKAHQHNIHETEFAEQHFHSRRKFIQSSAMAAAAVAAETILQKMGKGEAISTPLIAVNR